MVETTGLYKIVMDHLRKRMLFVDELGPPAICSIGSVIANLRQKQEPFHWVGGDDEDLGINLTYVAPSGMAKSHAMKQFVHRTKGICPVKCTFRGKITEAGFIGTIKEGEEKRGDAFDYAEGIVAFNEISNLFFTQQQDHSTELINQVMEALSEREVSKRLAAGAIEYETYVTLWGGIQPRRFDFSQGLGRRFLFVVRDWTTADLEALKELRMNRSFEAALDMKDVASVRDELMRATVNFAANEIKWEGDMLHYIKSTCDSHLQMQMMEKAVIGKETVDQWESDCVIIQDSKENRDLVKMFLRMQQMVSEGSDVALLINVLSEHGKPMTISELWDRFRIFHYGLSTLQELLSAAKKLKIIEIRTIGQQQQISLKSKLRSTK